VGYTLATLSTKFIAKLNSSFTKGEYLYKNFIFMVEPIIEFYAHPLIFQTSSTNNYNFEINTNFKGKIRIAILDTGIDLENKNIKQRNVLIYLNLLRNLKMMILKLMLLYNRLRPFRSFFGDRFCDVFMAILDKQL
jgi:hypothetical protein